MAATATDGKRMDNVCLTGTMTYPDGTRYLRADLVRYLNLLGMNVLDRVSGDCDWLVAERLTLNTHKMRDAARSDKADIIEWPIFAAWIQVRGFRNPLDLRYWKSATGALWCEIDETFEPGQSQYFFSINKGGRPRIHARPINDQPRWFPPGSGPLGGRLVVEHQLLVGEA